MFSHVMRLDQSRASENIWWIIKGDRDYREKMLESDGECYPCVQNLPLFRTLHFFSLRRQEHSIIVW